MMLPAARNPNQCRSYSKSSFLCSYFGEFTQPLWFADPAWPVGSYFLPFFLSSLVIASSLFVYRYVFKKSAQFRFNISGSEISLTKCKNAASSNNFVTLFSVMARLALIMFYFFACDRWELLGIWATLGGLMSWKLMVFVHFQSQLFHEREQTFHAVDVFRAFYLYIRSRRLLSREQSVGKWTWLHDTWKVLTRYLTSWSVFTKGAAHESNSDGRMQRVYATGHSHLPDKRCS